MLSTPGVLRVTTGIFKRGSLARGNATWPQQQAIVRRLSEDTKTTASRSEDTKPPRKVIFSGIQPTGIPHLGNYLGALQQWVKLQDEASKDTTLIYSLVDLHAITVRQDPKQLKQWRKESLAMLLAIGLDPTRSIIFSQSEVPAHAELMWILSCHASTGHLGRMTQWKDKTTNKQGQESQKLGLFSYPVLQAADVLVHGTTHVPVGHDQAQHLEFARTLANSFNSAYGWQILTPPDTIISPAKRIMSLTDSKVKMSKSHENPKSRILLTDLDGQIASKIKAAVTDSEYEFGYDPEGRPGVSNLLEMLFHLDPEARGMSIDDYAADLKGTTMPAFKIKLTEQAQKTIGPIRERFQEIVADPKALRLKEVADKGRSRANENAYRTLMRVKHAVGLAPRFDFPTRDSSQAPRARNSSPIRSTADDFLAEESAGYATSLGNRDSVS